MDFTQLTGPDIKKISSALRSAFPNHKRLKLMLHTRLDKILGDIVTEGSLEDTVYDLIIRAKSENWVEKLMEEAYAENPKNLELKELLRKEEEVIQGFNKNAVVEEVFEENLLDPLLEEIDELYQSLLKRTPEYKWLNHSKKNFNKIREKWEARRFQVAVIALMKSGKSTLLNSWIGYEFLPSSTTPETMRMIKIRHTPDKPKGVLLKDNEIVAEGVQLINKYIQKLNETERKSNQFGVEEMRLDVEFSTLKAKKLNGYGFDFLDTPGVNEFGIATLPSKVERLVKNSDVIIYLLDVTKLKSNEEKEMLENLKQWKVDLFTKLGYRLFFVVNKIDTLNRHDRKKGMTKEKIKLYVQDVLNSNLGLTIDIENIILISSERAVLSRAIEKGVADDGQIYDFKDKAFGESRSDDATFQECQQAVPNMLKKSGFKELEDKVLQTIYQNRSSILIDSVKSDLSQILNQILNSLEVGKGALITTVKDIKALRKRIFAFQSELEKINSESTKFKKKALNVIDKKFKKFKSNLKNLINETFSEITGASPKYPWIKFFTDMFNDTSFEITDTDIKSFQSKIYQINGLILTHIDSKFRILIDEIMADQYADFIEFREDIEEKSIPLIRKIETEIQETLNINLIPNNVFFAPPSIHSFFDDIDLHLNGIITSETKSNMNWFQSIWNRFLKLLNLSFQEEVFYEEYKINSSDYREVIFSFMEPIIEDSKEKATSHIDSKYLSTVNEAIDTITGYANKYTHIIENEIKTKNEGIIDVSLRVQNIDKDIQSVNYLNKKLDKLYDTDD